MTLSFKSTALSSMGTRSTGTRFMLWQLWRRFRACLIVPGSLGQMGCTTQQVHVSCREEVPGGLTVGDLFRLSPYCQGSMGPWAQACRWTVPVSPAGPETGFLGFSPSTPPHHHHNVVLPPSGVSQLRKVTVFPIARLLDTITWRMTPKSTK